MAKQIKRSEIAEQDLYKEIRDSAKKTITQINSLNKAMKKTAETLKKDLSQPLGQTLQNLQQLDSSVMQMNATMEQSIQLDKAKAEALKTQKQAEQEIFKAEQQRQKAVQAQMNTEKKKRLEKERVLKAQKKATKQAKDEANAYKQLEKRTRELKNRSKELGAQLLQLEASGKKNTKEYRRLDAEFRKVTKSAQAGDVALKKLDKQVGDNFRNVGNYRSALAGLRSGFAQLGLAFGGAMVIRDVFNVVKDFDQAQANLASVLGVSRDQMAGLTEQAKELGATTRFTASQVSELQLEFSKLGFTQSQIEGMTEATLNLAGATSSELGETATIVGATMRGFNLDVSETQRVTDVMSKSFTTSSLDMSKFSTAMASVAPVANIAGKSIEETTALLGVLSDRGIDASTAGTGLRNMFLKSNKAGLTFDEAMKQIRESTDQMGESMELFGTRGATLGVILANNTDDIEKLTTGLENAKGATKAMADEQLNTLGGSLDLLRSAWEGYILSVNDAGGVGEKLAGGFRFLAENLSQIINIIFKIIRAFVAYKTAMLSMKLINLALSSSFKDIGNAIMRAIPLTKAYKVEQQRLATATKGASTAMKGLGSAMASMGIGLAIGVVIELATAWYDVASGASEARRQQDLYNKAVEKGKNEGAKAIETANKQFNEEMRQINLKFRVEKAQAGSNQKRKALEVKRIDELTQAQQRHVDAIEAKIKKNREDYQVFRANYLKAQKMSKTERYTEWAGNSTVELTRENKRRKQLISQNNSGMAKMNAQKKELDKGLAEMNKALQEFIVQGIEAESDYSVRIADNTKERRANNTEFRRHIDMMKERLKLLNQTLKTTEDIQRITNKVQVDEQNEIIKEQKRKRKDAIKYGVDFDETALRNAISERDRLIKEGITRTNEYIKAKAKRDLEERFRQEKMKIIEQYSKLLAQDKLTANEREKIEKNYQTELDVIRDARVVAEDAMYTSFIAMDYQAKIKIINQTKKTNDELNKLAEDRQQVIDGIYTRQENEFKLSLLRSKKTNEEIETEMLDFQISQLEKRIEEYKKAGLKTLELEIELEEMRRQRSEKIEADILENQQKIAEATILIIQRITDAFIQASDKRIEKIDEEIRKAQERYNTYAELAKNGNILAKESLAEEQKIIAEQNRLKEKEERRKQRIQLASSVLQAYTRNASDPNVANPLAKTITDTVLLTQFIKNLPFFEEGTEDTGKNGRGVDGKGGFHAILHPNERVMTKEQNALIGGMTNDELSQLAYDYQNGLVQNMGDSAVTIGGAWQTHLIVEKLNNIEQTIRTKPETNIELEEIVQGAMAITRSTKKGNTKVFNRYRVK